MANSTIRESGFDIALGILRRRKWAGISAFIAALSLATPIAMFLPDVYRGVATVLVENQDVSSPLVHGSMPELETRLITIQQELLSRARLSELIKRLNLYPTWRAHSSMEAIVERMRRDIHVEPSRTDRGRPTTIGFKISYIGLDPRSAAAVPNALAAMYVEENTRLRARETGEMAGFLKIQLDAARRAVESQQARLNRMKEQRAGQLPEQLSINLVTLERLNARLRLNLDEQMKLRERQEELLRASSAVRETADPLVTAKQNLAALQSKFTEKHPDVIRAKAQIAEMEQERAARGGNAAEVGGAPQRAKDVRSDGEIASLQREERILRTDIAAYEQRIESAPKVERELEAVEGDYNAAKESYASMLKRYEEAQLADRLEQTRKAESFRILDSAIVPAFPAAPNRTRLLIIACFLAFASGIGMMLLTEHLDTSFHTVGELRQFTTVPVLSSIPYVSSRPTIAGVLRVALATAAVIGMCVVFAGFAYRAARENTQLVWMLSAPQL